MTGLPLRVGGLWRQKVIFSEDPRDTNPPLRTPNHRGSHWHVQALTERLPEARPFDFLCQSPLGISSFRVRPWKNQLVDPDWKLHGGLRDDLVGKVPCKSENQSSIPKIMVKPKSGGLGL